MLVTFTNREIVVNSIANLGEGGENGGNGEDIKLRKSVLRLRSIVNSQVWKWKVSQISGTES